MPTEKIIKLIRAMEENAYRLYKSSMEKYGEDGEVCKHDSLVWIERYQMLQILTDAEYAEKLFTIFCKEEVEESA